MMKIYFTASISGMPELGKNYRKIVETLESLGHEVYADHILGVSSKDLVRESQEQREEHYQNFKKWVGASEVVVAEVSHPSINVGYEVSWVLEREKPVICLHTTRKVPVLLVGVATDRLQVIEYSLGNLKNILPGALEYAIDQQDTRFNFFISPKIANFLDWIAKTKRVPRAVYLRKLIQARMKSDPEYNKS